MSAPTPPEISLRDLGLVTASIVVEHANGFLYSNQTHHNDCRHSEATGYLLPLDVRIMGGCWDCMDDKTTYSRFIKGLPLMPPEAMKTNIEASVDGAALDVLSDFKIAAHALNGEAWLRCSFHSASLSGARLDSEEARLFGWLTWGNCD